MLGISRPVTGVDDELKHAAEHAAQLLGARALACAESVSAGLVTQAFAAVEGSGEWLRGGVVAYQRDSKCDVLGVDPEAPLVSATVAEQMARGVARCMSADVAVATTGAAGPDGLDGAEPGTVVIATLVDGAVRCYERHYQDAEPHDVVQRAAVDAANALRDALGRGADGANGSCAVGTGTPGS